MLMYLALLCLLACLAGLLTRAIRAPFAQTLPLVLTGISLVTYLFTGAGEKEWLPLFVLPAAAAVLADLGLFWKGRLLKKRG